LCDGGSIRRMLGHYQNLLEGVAADAGMRLSDLSLLTETERQSLLEWNSTHAEYRQDESLHELIEEQVRRTPEAIAVRFEQEELTYHEINARANKLARFLWTHGVRHETPVGICVERSLEMVVGLLGILKSGGAFAPLDPAYPRERLAFMLEEASVPVLLTQGRLLESLPDHGAQVICLDADWGMISSESDEDLGADLSPDNLAYVIFTSGSTGRPKGAMNTQRGICNRLQWMQDAYGLGLTDRVLQKTPFSFDVSVWEFFWPLMIGARLIVARPGGHQDSGYIAEVIRKEEVSTLHFVPSMLGVFLEQQDKPLPSLRRVICSGEALAFDLQER